MGGKNVVTTARVAAKCRFHALLSRILLHDYSHLAGVVADLIARSTRLLNFEATCKLSMNKKQTKTQLCIAIKHTRQDMILSFVKVICKQ